MEFAIDALRPALRAVALHLGLDVADSHSEALLRYLALLQRWNATYNLTSIREPGQMLTHHLADCLAVIGPLRRQIGTPASRLLDVGSGGGLPGVVIAILNPHIDVTCIDAVGKKAAFVQQVAGELRLHNLHSQHARVELMRADPFHVVASRAFASLADFTHITRQHLGPNGVWMAMKGKQPSDELAQLPAEVRVLHVEQLAVPSLDAERCVVWMRHRDGGQEPDRSPPYNLKG